MGRPRYFRNFRKLPEAESDRLSSHNVRGSCILGLCLSVARTTGLNHGTDGQPIAAQPVSLGARHSPSATTPAKGAATPEHSKKGWQESKRQLPASTNWATPKPSSGGRFRSCTLGDPQSNGVSSASSPRTQTHRQDRDDVAGFDPGSLAAQFQCSRSQHSAETTKTLHITQVRCYPGTMSKTAYLATIF